MFQLAFRLALTLLILSIAAVALSHARPYDSEAVRVLLAAPADCAAPCWSGIRPGVTSAEDAVALLKANPWVDEIRPLGDHGLADSNAVVWSWKGTKPFPVDEGFGGVLHLARGVITDVTMPTLITLGDNWLLFGPAARGTFMHAGYPYSQYDIDDISYPERGLTLRLVVERPATFAHFWGARVTYIIAPVSIETPFRLPCWTACQP